MPALVECIPNFSEGRRHEIVDANFAPPRNRTEVERIVIQHYRHNTNVVNRPTLHSGEGYSFTWHHELMIPLMAWGMKHKLNL